MRWKRRLRPQTSDLTQKNLEREMLNIDHCLAAFARLSSEERERSIRLISAYNDAVCEAHPTNTREAKPSRSLVEM
jgi:hypothetical protein